MQLDGRCLVVKEQVHLLHYLHTKKEKDKTNEYLLYIIREIVQAAFKFHKGENVLIYIKFTSENVLTVYY